MRTLWRRTGILLAGLAIAGSAGWPQTNRAAQSGTYAIAHWQSAADQAARKNPDARVLVVEISSGRLLAHAPAKRSRNLRTEPRDGSLRRFVSGVKNLLAWLRKYTLLTMQAILNRHRLVWKVRNLRGVCMEWAKLFLTGPDWRDWGHSKVFASTFLWF